MNLNTLKLIASASVALAFSLPTADAATVAHWNFDSGIPGASMAGGGSSGVAAVPDLSGNNYTMWAWDDYYGPEYSAIGNTPSGGGLSSAHSGHDDGYVFDAGLVNWSPLAWTIEFSVKFSGRDGWNTMLGRDGFTGVGSEVEAGFYFQENGVDDRVRLNFSTAGGQRYILDSNFVPATGQWYHFAAVSDGSLLTMYADRLDGLGFQTVGSLGLNGTNNNALRVTGTWSFGRGWWNNNLTDHLEGNLDNIRLSDVALTPDQLLVVPEPSTMALFGMGALLGCRLLRRRTG